jgi:hypothetical protein
MKNKTLTFFFAAIVLVGSSCSKDKYGNTDISSDTYTTTWTYQDPSYYCDLNVPEITQDIVDNGAVFVYMSNGNSAWTALPCTIPIDGSYSSTYTPVHFVGGVRIWKTDTDLLTLDPGSSTFKVVVVSDHGLAKRPNLDWENYNEVKAEIE